MWSVYRVKGHESGSGGMLSQCYGSAWSGAVAEHRLCVVENVARSVPSCTTPPSIGLLFHWHSRASKALTFAYFNIKLKHNQLLMIYPTPCRF